MDFKGLKDRLGPSDYARLLAELIPDGKLRGNEFYFGSKEGDGGKSSHFDTRNGLWYDFNQGEGGDIYHLIAAVRRCSRADAFRWLSLEIGYEATSTGKPFPRGIKPSVTPDTILYPYNDAAGNTVAYVSRYDSADGKQIRQWSYDDRVMSKGIARWPIYRLPEVLKSKNRVFVVEGEKVVHSVLKAAPDICVCTWAGGANAWAKTDWAPLIGRRVVLCPDYDKAGRQAMESLAVHLTALGAVVESYVDPPSSAPPGWDLADLDTSEVVSYLQNNEVFVKPPVDEISVSSDGSVVASTRAVSWLYKQHGATWHQLGIQISDSGVPVQNQETVYTVLKNTELGTQFWESDFYARTMTTWKTPDGRPAGLKDSHYDLLVNYFSRELGLVKITKLMIIGGLAAWTAENARDEAIESVAQLKWDGKERIETAFIRLLGAEDTVYHRQASRNFFMSLIARMTRPGCKADNMVILEGRQGTGKSTWCQIIGGEFYRESNRQVSSRDFIAEIQGACLIEFGELESFGRAEANALKSIISCRVDEKRLAYRRNPERLPRRCIFIGTTNMDQYLNDETGARRFWPIETGLIDLEGTRAERDQLLAEAASYVNDGYPWHTIDHGGVREATDARYSEDIYVNVISEWLARQTGDFSLSDVAAGPLGMDPAQMTPYVSTRIRKILKRSGFKARRGKGAMWGR